jgi:preprotein translocase, yajC subunit
MIGVLTTGAAAGGESLASLLPMVIIWIVVVGGMMYFMSIKPQKKERLRMQELMSSLELGDSVLTTAGFYGVIIDIMEEIVVVEFGSNKNCRIPMKKTAIVEVEKPGQSNSDSNEKK